mmetsp:Transcript_32276/g.111072  ORF Transcript_32276/g.111072 Transcript_32276/m.111072 type:complete len:231 (+) Transcript_32276:1112-1804(+)
MGLEAQGRCGGAAAAAAADGAHPVLGAVRRVPQVAHPRRARRGRRRPARLVLRHARFAHDVRHSRRSFGRRHGAARRRPPHLREHRHSAKAKAPTRGLRHGRCAHRQRAFLRRAGPVARRRQGEGQAEGQAGVQACQAVQAPRFRARVAPREAPAHRFFPRGHRAVPRAARRHHGHAALPRRGALPRRCGPIRRRRVGCQPAEHRRAERPRLGPRRLTKMGQHGKPLRQR